MRYAISAMRKRGSKSGRENEQRRHLVEVEQDYIAAMFMLSLSALFTQLRRTIKRMCCVLYASTIILLDQETCDKCVAHYRAAKSIVD